MMESTLQGITATLADRYTIERELGAGGMATVYLAQDLKVGGVFVEPFPANGQVWAISGKLEGDVPYWSPRGDQIFFPSGSQLYVVDVVPGSPPGFGAPRLVSPARFANITGRPYAVSPNARRFLIKVPTAEHSASAIRLVLNQFAADGAPR